MKHIEQLREILGPDVLLLGWPKGTKGTKRKWGHLRAGEMGNPDYLARLKNKNIGVALGAVSGGLCSIDVDSDEAARSFLERNPALQHTFRTRGRKGCNIWLRFSGDDRPRGIRFLKVEKQPWGEFRADGGQTIVWGIHPQGIAYQWLTRHPVLTVDFQSIVWPDGISGLGTTASSQNSKNGTIAQRDRGDRETEEVRVCVSPLSPPVFGVVYNPELIVNESIPTGPGMNHKLLFHLNRGIARLELQQNAKMSPQDRIALFKRWYEQALETGFLDPQKSKDEYLLEFMSSSNVKIPLGQDPFDAAVARAKESPPPPEAEGFDHPGIRLLVAICYQLQLGVGGAPFFIAARKAGKALDVCHRTANTWLNGLCTMGILELVKKGGTKESLRDASRYRYVSLKSEGSLCAVDEAGSLCVMQKAS